MDLDESVKKLNKTIYDNIDGEINRKLRNKLERSQNNNLISRDSSGDGLVKITKTAFDNFVPMKGQYARGPHNYGKMYYDNFIRKSNFDSLGTHQQKRHNFIPQSEVRKTSFKERFKIYFEKLKTEQTDLGSVNLVALSSKARSVVEDGV